jgi:hypothetical protein
MANGKGGRLIAYRRNATRNTAPEMLATPRRRFFEQYGHRDGGDLREVDDARDEQ